MTSATLSGAPIAPPPGLKPSAVSARLRPLAWKGVRLTARQFLAGLGYTAGAAAAAELLGHVAVGSSPLMLLRQYLVQ
jgi:hypothetical protein